MELSLSQQKAFMKYKTGESVFITGPGGSGKSALISYMVKDAEEHGKRVQVCALTGTAAVLLNCNAKTIHSWAGIGLGNGDNQAIANKVNGSKYKKKNWRSVDLLIIDEVSMMSVKLFELLNMTGKLCRRSPRYFGGIQVIFTGDFFQLPPVGTLNIPETYQFCFESSLWNDIFTSQIQLTEIFRQTDSKYVKCLNQIRIGRLTKSTVECLRSYVGRVVEEGENILPTLLFPTRKRVEDINQKSLNALAGEEHYFNYQISKQNEFNLSESELVNASMFSSEQIDYEINYMVDNINFENNLTLKVGSQVMCIANLDMESSNPICNGSRGIVSEFDMNGFPVVVFKNGVTKKMGYHMWQSESISTVGIKQIPLILAWAITIHKSQGASLDLAEIDIGRGIFECGQTYVALSRVKSLDGLYLKSFDPSKIMIHKKVQDFYESLTV